MAFNNSKQLKYYNSGVWNDVFTSGDTSSLLTGLISYYTFDADATDSTGVNDGTNNGAIQAVGKINNGYDLDGSNDYIGMTIPFSSNEISISWWASPDVTNTTQVPLMISDGTSNNLFGVFMKDDATLQIYDRKTATTYSTIGDSYDTSMTFYTLVHSGTTGTLYKNGVSVLTVTSNSNSVNWTTLHVGKKTDASAYFFNGVIDEVGVWDKELTTDEITELYNSGNALAYPFEAVAVPFSDHATLGTDIVSYYTFDADATDSHGSNDGTVSGATQSVGKVNNCYSFDGVNDYISADVTLSSDYSVSLWFYQSSLDSDKALFGGNSSATKYSINIHCPTSGTIGFVTNGSDSYNHTGSFTAQEWHHVVITYNATTNKKNLWLDNVKLIDDVTPTGTAQYTNQYCIGRRGDPAKYWDGLIDEIGIWGKELTDTEVTDLYNSGNGLQY